MGKVWFVAGGLGAAVTSLAVAQWTVTNLHPAGSSYSRAHGVSGNQQVGVARIGTDRASMWSGTPESWTNLHPAGAYQSAAWDIDHGRAVGSISISPSPLGLRAAMWNGSAASYVGLHPVNARYSVAYGVEGNTQVGGAAMGGGNLHAAMWTGTAASFTDNQPVQNPLDPTRIVQSEFYGIRDGVLVGYWFRNPTPPIVMLGTQFSNSSFDDLTPRSSPFPESPVNCNIDMTSRGQNVGFVDFSESERHAVLWSDGQVIDLSPAGSSSSWGQGIWRGQQVGYATFDVQRAVLWNGSAASWVDLHAFVPATFTSSSARGIWSDRFATSVVGWGRNGATNRTEALLWTRQSCWADLTRNEMVDDEDFSLFASAYDAMVCPALLCPADLDDNGLVDDADFVIFLAAYETLLCP